MKVPELTSYASVDPWAVQQKKCRAEWAARLNLKNLSDDERSFLAVCQQMHRQNRGTVTPIESFLVNLISQIESDIWPTPEDIERELKEFKEDFEQLIDCAGTAMERYPRFLETQTGAGNRHGEVGPNRQH